MEKIPEGHQSERPVELQAIRDYFSLYFDLSPVRETPNSLTYTLSQEPSESKALEPLFENTNISVITIEREIEDGTVFDMTITQPQQEI
ncbi:MAG TPA: hypothetical protein VGE31_03015 [Candidatus Paceibacterota bacterium]